VPRCELKRSGEQELEEADTHQNFSSSVLSPGVYARANLPFFLLNMPNVRSKQAREAEKQEMQCHSAKTNLGQPGYKAMLVNLPAALKQYEGATTITLRVVEGASRRSSGVYEIEAVTEEGAESVHVRLRGKYLDPMLDRSVCGGNSKLELAKLHKTGYYNDCVHDGASGPDLSPGEWAPSNKAN
jgi:hypothetical protein